jgi:hypothetical protein
VITVVGTRLMRYGASTAGSSAGSR